MPEEIVNASQSLLRASMVRSGKWATGIAFLGGIISDILNPLAPFAAYISMAAAVAALVIAIAIVFRLLVVDKGVPALIFATTVAAIAGGIYALQQQNEAQDGLIANLVPAVADLQKSVGIVTAKVEEIQQTVTETQKTVEDVKKTTDEVKAGQEEQAAKTERLQTTTEDLSKKTDVIAENQVKQQETTEKLVESSEKIAASIETIADGFAQLATQGGIIADPKTPQDHYHNARVHELTGDMLNARRAYLAFAEFDVDAIDPYIRFATLLRVQDGKSGAREVFGVLAEKNKALSVKLVHALQFDDAQRPEKLRNFIAANPEFAPAYFLYSEEFSEDRLGVQSLADKRNEAEALTKFLSYEKDGGLLKFYVDQTLLADWIDRANRRLVALGNVTDPSLFMPKLISQRSNDSWMMTVTLSEAATAISWRLGKDGPFTETGFLQMNDQRTGKPMPNPSFALPTDTAATIIAIKYLDIRGQEAGPFDIAFTPEASLQDSNKQILDQFWTSWIAFDASGNQGNIYFTHLTSYRCAIKEAKYGLNGGALTETLEMPACNMDDPYALPADFMPYFKVGEDVKSMQVQLTYVDGTQSVVREFKR
ncbi:MAG TPA: methyl-accepting chemotaxis protein [Rhizobiaceae bacterium]|nr:methyl-accepting chemotaxis protein [Rhizobiaceae bacterium]